MLPIIGEKMKILTDSAANLSPEQAVELGVEVIPFHINFMGKTYRDGIDLSPAQLYRLYSENPLEFSKTSQPSVGDFIDIFKKCGETDILSMQLSSGLSSAYSAAKTAADQINDPGLVVWDSKMVGPALGWMVELAARGANQGWSIDRILKALDYLKQNMLTMVSFTDVRYLLHSGRISHLKGLVASVLKIKPIIGMDDVDGKYTNIGRERTIKKAAEKMDKRVHEKFGSQKIRLQLLHGDNMPGVELLRSSVNALMNCFEDQLVSVTSVLGAHAGPTVFGLAAMPSTLFDEILCDQT
jgi:DegV family protein with EDD domain